MFFSKTKTKPNNKKNCNIIQKMFIDWVVLVSGVWNMDADDLAAGFLILLIIG